MFHLKVMLTIATLAAFGSSHAAPVTVLGFPLGSKYSAPKRKCSMREIGAENIKSSCWVGDPIRSGDWVAGGLEFPGADKLPIWAAHAVFSIRVRSNGILDSVSVSTPGSNDYAKLYDSIAQRFGPARGKTRGTSAEWKTDDVQIRLLCYRDECKADFTTTEPDPVAEKKAEQQRKRDAARPSSV